MKRVDQLITEIRGWTNNTNYSTTAGIAQERFVEAVRDAQQMLQGAVMRANPDCSWFDTQATYSVTSGTTSYGLPADVYYYDQVKIVEFSQSGNADDYVALDPIKYETHSQNASWPPFGYDVIAGQVWLTPPPNSTTGTLRVTYVKRMSDLDLVRGTISSYAAPPALVLANDSFLDATSLTAWVPGYISVTRRLDGASITKTWKATAYTSGTFTLTAAAADVTYETGFSATDLPAAFVTLGKYTTCATGNWPVALQPLVERYVVAFGKWKMMLKDSSDDAVTYGNELTAIEKDIMQAAQAPDTVPFAIAMDNAL